jgi:hypothetical protein
MHGWGMRGFSLVDAAAEVTGLTAEEVITALEEGQTFAEIAEAEGVDPQTIADAFLAEREAALEEAVADGRLTEEQADLMLEQMAEHVSEQLEESWMPRSFGDGLVAPRRWGKRGFSLVDAAAEVTGLTAEEVITALQEGETFAEIAEAEGVDPQAIADAFLAEREAALEEAVADDRLTEEQADRMLEQMTEHVSERLEESWMPHSFGGGRMGPPMGGCGGWAQPRSGFGPRFSPRW